ncbi:hypothetical protein [Spiroplasma endosymbiont of Othius punctulatus]|uniref:hypothetical protein n=1 Tax=Spiroplasma endosymbiont of Othius punctulatus TaxID=3066289 RepID=UPI0030D25EF4
MFYKLKERQTVNYFYRSSGDEESTLSNAKQPTNGSIINLDKIIYIEEVNDETDDNIWNLYFDGHIYIPVSEIDWIEIKKLLKV